MKFWKRIATILTALCLTFGTATLAVACGGDDPAPVTPAKTEATLTLTVKTEEGTPVAGVGFLLTLGEDVTLLTTDENGTATHTGKTGTYTLKNVDGIPAYHDADWTFTEWEVELIDDKTVALVLEDATPDGSQDNPYIYLSDEDGAMSVTLPANGTVYFVAYRFANQAITIANENVKLTYGGQTYTAVGGTLTVDFGLTNNFEGAEFSVTNLSDSALTVNLQRTNLGLGVEGSSDNPFTLTLGTEITAVMGDLEEVYYKWTATGAGTLTVSSTSEIDSIVLENATHSVVADSTADSKDGTATLTVAAGDVVYVKVSLVSTAVGTVGASVPFTAVFTAN